MLNKAHISFFNIIDSDKFGIEGENEITFYPVKSCALFIFCLSEIIYSSARYKLISEKCTYLR